MAADGRIRPMNKDTILPKGKAHLLPRRLRIRPPPVKRIVELQSRRSIMNNPLKDSACHSIPWNKGKLVGQKAPLRVSEIWAIRVRLEIFGRARDLALFNLAIDSKLRGCDLVRLRVNDVCHGSHVAARASVMQQKTKQPVQFELTAGTRRSLGDWIAAAALRQGDFLFPSRISEPPHIRLGSTRVLFTNGSKK
jgi:integrase